MAALSAWLFDVYPDADGMRLWLLDDGGRMHTLHDTFTPCFYARGPLDDVRAVARMLRARRAPVTLRRAERRDLFLDREVEVLEIGVRLPALLATVLRWSAEFRPYLTYYDADIPLPQRYVLARSVFPLAACDVEYDSGGQPAARHRHRRLALGGRLSLATVPRDDPAPEPGPARRRRRGAVQPGAKTSPRLPAASHQLPAIRPGP